MTAGSAWKQLNIHKIHFTRLSSIKLWIWNLSLESVSFNYVNFPLIEKVHLVMLKMITSCKRLDKPFCFTWSGLPDEGRRVKITWPAKYGWLYYSNSPIIWLFCLLNKWVISTMASVPKNLVTIQDESHNGKHKHRNKNIVWTLEHFINL